MNRSITLQQSLSVAAGATNNNVLQETRLVQTPHAGLLTLFANGSAAGLKAQLIVGADEVMIESDINAFNRFPETDKDGLVFNVPAMAGDRVTLRVTNPTGGALTFFYRMILAPARGGVRRR